MLSYIRVSPTKFTSGPTALGINVKRRKFLFENSPRKQKESVCLRLHDRSENFYDARY
jgi:hypothetical protein